MIAPTASIGYISSGYEPRLLSLRPGGDSSMLRSLLAVLTCAALAASASAQSFPADRPLEQAIDHYVDVRLAEDKVTPAPLADDATLLRRLMLDLAGRVPTVAELDAYLADTDPAKKTKLVDRLL